MGEEKIAVIGCGSWGTAVANLCADAGFETTIWGRDEKTVSQIQLYHENSKYLPGHKLNERLKGSNQLEALLKEATILVCSIPTQQIRSVFSPGRNLLDAKLIVNTSKGIEQGTHALVSQIFHELAPQGRYAVLSGPSFALEVVKRLPTAVTAASENPKDVSMVQRMLSNSYFRIYTTTDVVGVELGGALKNVIAIASGVVVGLKLGYNAQAAIINRGIAEILRMAKKKGANPLTFLGLSGMGDLILTCTGPLSRNFKLGIALGEGKKLEQIQRELGGVAEGVYTSQSAYELSQQLGIDMPITEQVYRLLYKGTTPDQAWKALMARDLREEWDIS